MNQLATPSGESPERLLDTASGAAAAAAGIHRDAARRGGTWRIGEKSTASDFVSEVDLAARGQTSPGIRGALHPRWTASLCVASCTNSAAIRAAKRLASPAQRPSRCSGEIIHGLLAAQEAALAVIVDRHPHHRVMAEEEGGGREGAPGTDFLWLVDPLDGTTNFLHGHPYHAASVCVWDRCGPVAAAVEAPALGRVWTATRGQGAHENGKPIRVSRTARIERFLLGTGFPFKHHAALPAYLRELERALRATSGVRRTGAAAIDLAYVASGILDAFWESRLAPWDYAAGALLVEEAGGVVEWVEGGEVGVKAGSVIAANGAYGLAELRRVLRR